MQRVAIAGLFAVLMALFGSEGRAQSPYFGRTTVSRSSHVREADASVSSRSAARGRSENGDYRRAGSRVPVQETRPVAQVHRNYFPGLPTGQGPNRNYIDPSRLCVPGRRAFIYGR